mmetsp:Transcript_57586/g.187058  ORF Transcript_57586/g.187058 Transcript_57586/m.187058 type:complete len:277 (-) Transcript_57586:98-928(-)
MPKVLRRLLEHLLRALHVPHGRLLDLARGPVGGSLDLRQQQQRVQRRELQRRDSAGSAGDGAAAAAAAASAAGRHPADDHPGSGDAVDGEHLQHTLSALRLFRPIGHGRRCRGRRGCRGCRGCRAVLSSSSSSEDRVRHVSSLLLPNAAGAGNAHGTGGAAATVADGDLATGAAAGCVGTAGVAGGDLAGEECLSALGCCGGRRGNLQIAAPALNQSCSRRGRCLLQCPSKGRPGDREVVRDDAHAVEARMRRDDHLAVFHPLQRTHIGRGGDDLT